MKNLFFITCIAVLLSSCGIYRYRSFDLNLLTFGMTKREVLNMVGRPNRVLVERLTKEGYQEVLEYNNAYNEYFAIEFWNNYLTGYEFLYEDITYVPSVLPPVRYPDRGKPVYVYLNRPGYNNQPVSPSKPNLPNQSGKPNQPSQPSQPSKPNQPSKPTYPSSPSRPETPAMLNRASAPSTDKPSDSKPSSVSTSSGKEPSETTNRSSNASRSSSSSSSSTRESSTTNEQQTTRSTGGKRTKKTN